MNAINIVTLMVVLFTLALMLYRLALNPKNGWHRYGIPVGVWLLHGAVLVVVRMMAGTTLSLETAQMFNVWNQILRLHGYFTLLLVEIWFVSRARGGLWKTGK